MDVSAIATLAARIEALENEVAQIKVQLGARSEKSARRLRPGAHQRYASTAIKILAAITTLGGVATVEQLRVALPTMPPSSIRRTCRELSEQGQLRHVAWGAYELVTIKPTA
jgi:hypothetical protein